MDAIIEFLEYVDAQPRQSVRHLLDRILWQTRKLTSAEAGTIFIRRQEKGQHWLEAMRAQNDAVPVKRRGFIVPLPSPTIAGYSAESGRAVTLNNVYAIPPGAPYRFNPAFERPGYRTVSMLCFPLKNHDGELLGVVQLINRRVAGHATPAPFGAEDIQLTGLIARVVAGLLDRTMMLEQIRKKNAELARRNRVLAEQQQRIASLHNETEDAFMMSITLLARAAEIHDEGTGNHIVRVNEYSHYIAKLAGLPADFCTEIRYSAQLHDVGKMSVDAAVLKKPGRLTPSERLEMDNHVIYGKQILERSPRLRMAADIAIAHHEKWDGTGYPNRLKGEAIPLAARIVALADVYDALRAARPYKPALDHETTMNIMLNGDDRLDPLAQFDPAMLALLRDNHQGLADIWQCLHD